MDDSYDLLSGDHFHVILHPDRVHGLIFNRLDRNVTTINYEDAKELANVRYVGRVYGIIGRFLDKHLVLIKGRSKVGSLFEPNSKTEHDVYVITQVQVIDLSNHATAPKTSNQNIPTSKTSDSVKYDATSDRRATNEPMVHMSDLSSNQMKTSDSFSSLPITINTNSYLSSQTRPSNWNPFKLANSLKPIVSSHFLKSSNQTSSRGDQQPVGISSRSNVEPSELYAGVSLGPDSSQSDEAGKRLVDEMMKLFNSTNSFYYSPTLDLTNRFSRKNLIRRVGNEHVWREADERFFWNKHMLKDLIELSKEDSDANYFICVILQGFIAIHQQTVRPPIDRAHGGDREDIERDGSSRNILMLNRQQATRGDKENDDLCDIDGRPAPVQQGAGDGDQRRSRGLGTARGETYTLALVSRRSVFQAGTRYRRRGCDENGHCANFVETEQIFKMGRHFTSLVMLRGSIPLFWYQSGMNYRPPPVLTRSEEENHDAFRKHFLDLMHQYETEQVVSVDLTEKTGREKALHDAYRRHMDKFRETHVRMKLIEFDYHKYCRGRQCTDAQIEGHLNACGLSEQILKDVKYYWNDGEIVLKQEGLFRVNCLDCSDRTNVVQRIIALMVLDIQLIRLGVIAPDMTQEENHCRRIMQSMWSTNGNVLSTQYCGTRALFGGDRKLAGYLKDTYSSASRYYMSKFRDVYRQAAIDAMLGIESIDPSELESGTLRDQYELLSFDPILAGQRGGAILRDVGSRVSNRLARLKGRFDGRLPANHGQLGAVSARHGQQTRPMECSAGGIVETGLIETLGEMSIDWPSSEDVSNQTSVERAQEVVERDQVRDMFERYACEDNFQDDDEFGQLMLSIDVAELARLRQGEDERRPARQGEGDRQISGEFKREVEQVHAGEQIDLKESRGVNAARVASGQQPQENKLGDGGPSGREFNTTST